MLHVDQCIFDCRRMYSLYVLICTRWNEIGLGCLSSLEKICIFLMLTINATTWDYHDQSSPFSEGLYWLTVIPGPAAFPGRNDADLWWGILSNDLFKERRFTYFTMFLDLGLTGLDRVSSWPPGHLHPESRPRSPARGLSMAPLPLLPAL